MKLNQLPYLIEFASIGNDELGYLNIAESLKNIPFNIKRVFWLNGITNEIERGNHAHRETQQVLICLSGSIEFFAEMPDGSEYHFRVDNPNVGIYIPSAAWHRMNYQPGTIQVVLASTIYAESDYFRKYEDFRKYYRS